MCKNKHEQPQLMIGEKIKYFRIQKGISTNKLANLAGISQSYLRDVEMDNKNPTIEILYLICQALNITIVQFFDDKNSELLSDDPLIQRIYQLTPRQKDTLLAFLQTIWIINTFINKIDLNKETHHDKFIETYGKHERRN